MVFEVVMKDDAGLGKTVLRDGFRWISDGEEGEVLF
jgi:hypothetical protein